MKLRQKTLIVISTVIANLIVVLCATVSMMLLYDFQDLEVNYVRQDVARALNELDGELSNLSTIGKQNTIFFLSKKLVNGHKLKSDTNLAIDKLTDFNSINNLFINQKLNLILQLNPQG